MALVQLTIDPSEVRAIRLALEELVTLTRAKLLADGYLRQPQERVPSTQADVRIVDGRSAWLKKQEEKLRNKRLAEELREVTEDLSLVMDSPSPSQSDLP